MIRNLFVPALLVAFVPVLMAADAPTRSPAKSTKSPGSKTPGTAAATTTKGPSLDETMDFLVKTINENGNYDEVCRSSSNIRKDGDASGSVDLVMTLRKTASASRAGDCVIVLKQGQKFLEFEVPEPAGYEISISFRDLVRGSAELVPHEVDAERVCTPTTVYWFEAKAGRAEEGVKVGDKVTASATIPDRAIAEQMIPTLNRAIELCGGPVLKN